MLKSLETENHIFMEKAEVKYTDEPLGELRIIDDFLPSPKQLVFQEEKVKVTLTLSKASLDFFKREAEKHHTQYQKMIRKLLDVYAEQRR